MTFESGRGFYIMLLCFIQPPLDFKQCLGKEDEISVANLRTNLK
jgi:hypothetical protein